MKVIHIDGPPFGYVEALEDGAERLVYRTFLHVGREPYTLILKLNEKIEEVERQVCLRAEAIGRKPIILWRKRPSLIAQRNEDGSTVAFLAHFRLTTIPQLTTEQWEDLDPQMEGSSIPHG